MHLVQEHLFERKKRTPTTEIRIPEPIWIERFGSAQIKQTDNTLSDSLTHQEVSNIVDLIISHTEEYFCNEGCNVAIVLSDDARKLLLEKVMDSNLVAKHVKKNIIQMIAEPLTRVTEEIKDSTIEVRLNSQGDAFSFIRIQNPKSPGVEASNVTLIPGGLDKNEKTTSQSGKLIEDSIARREGAIALRKRASALNLREGAMLKEVELEERISGIVDKTLTTVHELTRNRDFQSNARSYVDKNGVIKGIKISLKEPIDEVFDTSEVVLLNRLKDIGVASSALVLLAASFSLLRTGITLGELNSFANNLKGMVLVVTPLLTSIATFMFLDEWFLTSIFNVRNNCQSNPELQDIKSPSLKKLRRELANLGMQLKLEFDNESSTQVPKFRISIPALANT